MSDSISIRTANPAELERAIDVVLLAFASDPFTRWVFPEAASYLEYFRGILSEFGGCARRNETLFVTEDFGGAALWIPPGAKASDDVLGAIVERAGARVGRKEEFFAIFENMARFHPDEPHWYLPMIGVDPAHQNGGRGAALMRHALARADAAHVPAYLESSNPANISLYERHGFERMGKIVIGDSPLMTPMYRPAR